MRRHIRPGDFWRLARTCPRLSPIVEDAYALPPIQFLRVLVRPNVTAVLHKTTFNKDKLISRPVIIPAVSRWKISDNWIVMCAPSVALLMELSRLILAKRKQIRERFARSMKRSDDRRSRRMRERMNCMISMIIMHLSAESVEHLARWSFMSETRYILCVAPWPTHSACVMSVTRRQTFPQPRQTCVDPRRARVLSPADPKCMRKDVPYARNCARWGRVSDYSGSVFAIDERSRRICEWGDVSGDNFAR